MTAVLALLLVNVVLGAWDTLWYHEYRGRLAAKLDTTRVELRLHAARDGVYFGIYGVLALFQPAGIAVGIVLAALVVEVVITLTDFVVEDRDRPAIGGIAAGERVLHSLMAIVYGAMLAHLAPLLIEAASLPSGLVRHDAPVWMSIAALASAAGIALSGLRDAAAVGGHVWDPWGTEVPDHTTSSGLASPQIGFSGPSTSFED